jgi:hypothetical protein
MALIIRHCLVMVDGAFLSAYLKVTGDLRSARQASDGWRNSRYIEDAGLVRFLKCWMATPRSVLRAVWAGLSGGIAAVSCGGYWSSQ